MKRHVPSESVPVPAVVPMAHETLVAGFGAKDRQSYERHTLAYEAKAGADALQRWRHFACLLMALAPHPSRQPTRYCNTHGMQFFIPDGKYRRQVFALRGLGDGSLEVYLPDVLSRPLPHAGGASLQRDAGLTIDHYDGKTPNPDPIYKDMTGWNRRAIRVTLPPRATSMQIETIERLCTVAATEWALPPE